MASKIINHFILENDTPIPDLEFYLNSNGEIFVGEIGNPHGFFFTINPPDWEKLKKFIDEQFKENK
jgi:hypothetical protein